MILYGTIYATQNPILSTSVQALSKLPFRHSKSLLEKTGKAQDGKVELAPCLLPNQGRACYKEHLQRLYWVIMGVVSLRLRVTVL